MPFGTRATLPFPALHRAGLIEGPRSWARSHGRTWFPALHRAGLIEGQHPIVVEGPIAQFPALHRAGLIEGVMETLAVLNPFVSFRPFTGPASLKVGRRRELGLRLRPRFRPFTGPASLKEFQRVEAPGRVVEVSGPSQGRPH